jgi:hypothetical protein
MLQAAPIQSVSGVGEVGAEDIAKIAEKETSTSAKVWLLNLLYIRYFL